MAARFPREDRLAGGWRVTRGDLLAMILLGALYFAAAKLGLRLSLVRDNVTPLWAPTGIALVAFLRYGRRLWPGVAAAAFLVNLPISTPVVAATTALGNTVAPLFASWLLERLGFRLQFDRVRDVAALVFAALLSMTVSASVGVLALVVSDTIPSSGFWTAWSVWWAGDAMGVLVFGPFLLCLLTWRDAPGAFGWRGVIEALLLFGAVFGATLIAVTSPDGMLFLVPPMVGWVAWRFQLRGAAPAVLLASSIAVWGAVNEVGWFEDTRLLPRMLMLQAFNATVAFTGFFLAALVTERTRARESLERAAEDLEIRVTERTSELSSANRHLAAEIAERREAEARLRRNERELAEAQEVAQIGRWEWDLATGQVTWSDEMYRIHGHAPQAFPVTFDTAVQQVSEDDRRRIDRNVAEGLAGKLPELREMEYRITRPGGEERVLLGKGRLFFGHDGTPLRMVGVVQDITERREFERQHLIADRLQRALLPRELPTIDGFALAARYVPAEVGMSAGGDWYDVIPLRDGRLGLVIGDVAGHGLDAASLMGQLRMAVRAYALEGRRPGEILAQADAVLQAVAPDELVTMLYVEVDADGAEARVVSAGHPPPVVSGPDGTTFIEPDPDPGPALGLLGTRIDRERTVPLGPGTAIVLYTDGLIDRRDVAIDDGMRSLLDVVDRHAGAQVEDLCREVITRLAPAQVTDDVALLALQVLPVETRDLRVRFPAEPRRLAGVRRSLGRWLRANGLEDGDVRDLVLASSEACSNSIKHAYGPVDGTVELSAALRGGVVTIEVRDFGRWRPARGDHGGRGLALIEALTPSPDIVRDDGGTMVRIRREVAGRVSV